MKHRTAEFVVGSSYCPPFHGASDWPCDLERMREAAAHELFGGVDLLRVDAGAGAAFRLALAPTDGAAVLLARGA